MTPSVDPAPRPLKVGLLDFCGVGPDGDARGGLAATIDDAILADRLGFHRYWLAEHWSADAATPSPEGLLPVIAGLTVRIRVGPAGILLALYSPLKVASTARLLETLFPGRTDLGLARGGASPAVLRALTGREGAEVFADYPEKVAALAACLDGEAEVPALPAGLPSPELWVLGSGRGSAPLAAAHGAAFALSLFHAGSVADPAIVAAYRAAFQPAPARPAARACLALAGICAESTAEAERLASARDNGFVRPVIVGTVEHWRDEVARLAEAFSVDEVVLLDLHPDPASRAETLARWAAVFQLPAEAA